MPHDRVASCRVSLRFRLFGPACGAFIALPRCGRRPGGDTGCERFGWRTGAALQRPRDAPRSRRTFAAEGALPAIAGVLAGGARANGGLAVPFPATSGTNPATLLTGTWPAEHGIVADRFFRTGSPDFADFATWADRGLIQADTLPQAAERAGKQVVSVGWEGLSALDPPLGGPVVAGPIPYSQAGVVTNIDLADQPANAERLGVGYNHVNLRPAEGWTEPRGRSARRRRPNSPSAPSIRPDRIRIDTLPSISTTPATMRP